jgi:hypothetical protein
VNAWAPAVFAHRASDRWRWTGRTGLVLAATVTLGASGVALLAPWLVAVAAPPTFDHALIVDLVSILVLVAPAYLLYNGAALAIIDSERTGRLAGAAAAAALVLLVGGAVLAGVAGVMGVAAARVTGYVLLAILVSVQARRQGLRWEWRATSAVFVLAAAGASAGAFLPFGDWGSVVRCVAAVVLGLTVLLGANTLRRRMPARTSPS